ncbi:MAG: chorismate synthase [Clostridia bacterium]|nr:chorismate synthase [Clostridia bacterium]
MKLVIENRTKPKGAVALPPSKSEAIRVSLLLALAGDDPARAVSGFEAPFCRDIECAIGAARELGKRPFVGESAALLRMLLPVSLALFGRAEVTGADRLFARGIGELEECLGTKAKRQGSGLVMEKRLSQSVYEIDCSRSSQFLSGLLIALPLLDRDCEIVIKNGLVSKPYSDMTLHTARLFGARIEETETGYVTRPSRYTAPDRIPVMGDRSCAAVFEAMDLFGGEVTTLGERDDLQPDQRFLLISSLPEIDVADCPDLLPLLAVAACGKAGDTVISGTARLSSKESDRPRSVERLIRDLGGEAVASGDTLTVHGSGWLRGGACSACGDHRIAFAAAVASLISTGPVILEGAECTAKSAPRFWDDLKKLGVICKRGEGMDTIGKNIRLTLTGASHAPSVGCVLEGIPKGVALDMDAMRFDIKRRSAASFGYATNRHEADEPEILSGVENGVTTGAAITAVFRNRAYDRSGYAHIARPSHADYCAFVKSCGGEDISGGGRYSGRMTLPLVFAGSVARQLLEKRGIDVFAHVKAIGDIKDADFDPVMDKKPEMDPFFPLMDPSKRKWMEELINTVRAAGDTLSCEAECAALGLPVGLGSPLFDGLEGVMAKYLFMIPGLRGVEFGTRRTLGSRMNDQFAEGGRTLTNNSGGVNGGMANGMPLVFRCWFRPVPSISLPQTGYDLIENKPVPLTIDGRHDTSILPRGLVAVEAAACLALLELLTDD